jgi:predicted glycosyltransferase
MAGYNTICEILSLGKRAVVVPRVRPVQEQWIRADKLARLGAIRCVHPDVLTPGKLAWEVQSQLRQASVRTSFPASLDGLDHVADWVRGAALAARNPGLEGRLACHA